MCDHHSFIFQTFPRVSSNRCTITPHVPPMDMNSKRNRWLCSKEVPKKYKRAP